MAGEPYVPDLALLPGADQRLDHSPFREVTLGVVEVDTFVDLPEIEVIGPQPPKRLLELGRIATFASRPCVQTFNAAA